MNSQLYQKQHSLNQQQITNTNTTSSMIQISNEPQTPISPIKSEYYSSGTYNLQKSKHNNQKQTPFLNLGNYENSMLREQNKLLKKQLILMKGQSQIWTADSSRHDQHYQRLQSFDVRQFQKKQEEQLLQLRNWVDVLRKQCKMYEEIINKMDQNIANLTEQNKKLNNDIKIIALQKQNIIKTHKLQKIEITQKYASKQAQSSKQLKQLKQKVNTIMEMYGQLESEANKSEIEWSMWKQKWNKQKMGYVSKIQDMQQIIFEMRSQNRNTKQSSSTSKDKYMINNVSMNTSSRQSRREDRHDPKYDSVQDHKNVGRFDQKYEKYVRNQANIRINSSYERNYSPTNRNQAKEQSRRKY